MSNPSRLTAAFSYLKLIQFILINLLTIVRYSLIIAPLKRNNANLIGDREMAKSHYLSDAPQVKSHMVFLDDFHSGYSNTMDKINGGASVDALSSELRGDSVPVNKSMNDYFYGKGQWAAVMDNN